MSSQSDELRKKLEEQAAELIADVMIATHGTEQHRPMSVLRGKVADRLLALLTAPRAVGGLEGLLKAYKYRQYYLRSGCSCGWGTTLGSDEQCYDKWIAHVAERLNTQGAAHTSLEYEVGSILDDAGTPPVKCSLCSHRYHHGTCGASDAFTPSGCKCEGGVNGVTTNPSGSGQQSGAHRADSPKPTSA